MDICVTEFLKHSLVVELKLRKQSILSYHCFIFRLGFIWREKNSVISQALKNLVGSIRSGLQIRVWAKNVKLED